MHTQPAIETLTRREFEQIMELAYETCGIDLRRGKQELIQARISKQIRLGNFNSFHTYYRHVVEDKTGRELVALLDSLTTNFTFFLREAAHFDLLRQTILPGISGPVRIWSAACSTGEEPYTIAFSLLEELGTEAADRIHIAASDLCSHALATAARGAYQAERFKNVPKHWMSKYLLRGSDRWEGWFRIKEPVRRLVHFERLNLMQAFLPEQPYHVIFCRNVMIYFDKETQEQLVNRFAPCLAAGGYLLIGHSESLTGLKHPYEYVRPAVYRKRV